MYLGHLACMNRAIVATIYHDWMRNQTLWRKYPLICKWIGKARTFNRLGKQATERDGNCERLLLTTTTTSSLHDDAVSSNVSHSMRWIFAGTFQSASVPFSAAESTSKMPPKTTPTATTSKKQQEWKLRAAVFFALLIFRVVNAHFVQTFFQPDEYFQALEPAWDIAFGPQSGAWITWVFYFPSMQLSHH